MKRFEQKLALLSNVPAHFLIILLAFALIPRLTTLNAQEYEYEPDEGLHQEEWYDPSDWFDDTPGIDYEEDWWDYPYGYTTPLYDPEDRTGDYDYYEDPNNNVWSRATIQADNQRPNLGWHYDWNPVSGTWDSDYGYYDRKYTFDATSDYGWHFDWNPNAEQWEADYGWHTSNWDYDQQRFDYGRQNRQQQQTAQNLARRQRQQNQQRARQSTTQTRDLHQVRGEIENIRRINFRDQQGERVPRVLANVRLDNGQRVVIDLGRRNPESLGVDRGDRVILRGRTVEMNGRDILLAQQVRIDGQRFNVRERSSQLAQQGVSRASSQGRGPQQEQGRSGQSVEIQGQLEELQRANLGGIGDNRTVARVTLQNGREVLVDLGADFAQRYGQDRMQQLLRRADQGDQIRIRGQRQVVNGREIIQARQFRLERQNVLQQQNQSR